MQSLIVLSALIVVAFATNEGAVNLSEDTLGNYKLNYDTKEASRAEQRFEDGKVVGSYKYVDDEGKQRTINYVAGGDAGFRAEGSGIPVPVPETPELIRARAEHFAAVAHELARNSQ